MYINRHDVGGEEVAVKYLVTGGAGHLGNTVVRALLKRGENVRVLLYYNEKLPDEIGADVACVEGDVRDIASLAPFFENAAGDELIVIHCAGMVSITVQFDKRLYDTNVTGTKNIIGMCKRTGVRRLVYISSVHAIPELKKGEMMSEVCDFSPAAVRGAYAKTKAEATAAVLMAARDGLDAVVVHPSGIAGPYDYGRGHLTQLITDCASGALFAGVKGGYDFVDVRDVAEGILACAQQGKAGECYILSNRYLSVTELLGMLHDVGGLKKIKSFMPLWLAKMTAPFAETYYKLKGTPPLYTPYSLYTLSCNSLFSHEKASAQLGYRPRPFEATVADTVAWLKAKGRIMCG